MPYHERVPATPAFRWLLWAILAASAAVAVGVASGEGRVWVGVLVAAGILVPLVLLDRWFMALRVSVDPQGVTARFGPFSKHLPAPDVEGAEVEPYRWTAYGGWGIRYSGKGRRAWSVPFVNTGVAVALRGGSRYFISSKQPAQLRAAIVDVIEGRGGTRG